MSNTSTIIDRTIIDRYDDITHRLKAFVNQYIDHIGQLSHKATNRTIISIEINDKYMFVKYSYWNGYQINHDRITIQINEFNHWLQR